MANVNTNLLDFLKPVIWTVCIVLGLWGAEKILDIDLSRLKKIGPGGVEFETTAQNLLGQLEQRINQLEIQLSIREEYSSMLSEDFIEKEEKEMVLNIDKLQMVQDNIAMFSYVDQAKEQTKFFKQEGYIWIGDYNIETSKWKKVQLRSIDLKRLISVSPEGIKRGDQFEVTGNMVLREKEPGKNIDYLKNTERKGIIPAGTKITVLEKPIKIESKFAVQYWARVRVEQ